MKRFVSIFTISFLGLMTVTAVQAGNSVSQNFKIKVTLPAIARLPAPAEQFSSTSPTAQPFQSGEITVTIEETVRDNQPVILKSYVIR